MLANKEIRGLSAHPSGWWHGRVALFRWCSPSPTYHCPLGTSPDSSPDHVWELPV